MTIRKATSQKIAKLRNQGIAVPVIKTEKAAQEFLKDVRKVLGVDAGE